MIEYLLALALVLTVIVAYSMLSHAFMSAPYVMASHRVVEQILHVSSIQPHQTVYDLGCGDARFLVALKKQEPTVTAVGYELVPAAFLQAWWRVWQSKTEVKLRFRSLFKADVLRADVIYIYLYPQPLRRLSKIFNKEVRSGTRVFSLTFQFHDKTPVAVHTLSDGKKERTLYEYRW